MLEKEVLFAKFRMMTLNIAKRRKTCEKTNIGFASVHLDMSHLEK